MTALANEIVEELLPKEYRAEIFPVKSVGVKGDERVYGPSMAIIGPAPFLCSIPMYWRDFQDMLAVCSSKITNEVENIVRVVVIFADHIATE